MTARGRVLLAGDAGGFVNGFTAEGIYFAMVTGELAAQAILEAARRRRPAATSGLWRREIGAELRDSRFLSQFVFADLSRVDRLVSAVRALPACPRCWSDYATGTDTYRGVRRRFVLKFPRIGAKLALSYLRRQRAAGTGRPAM